MEINLNYVPSESIGYGRLGLKLAEALMAKGVTIYDHMPPPSGIEFDTTAAKGRNAGTTSTACWVSVPTHASGWWSTQRPIIFTMWESMRLPESFRENLHHFDTVLVPSDQNIELFSRYHPNVKRVLLGVDGREWHYEPRPSPDTFFDFLIGGSGARKGTDLAFDAFGKAFPSADGDGPIPRLVMKNPRGEPFEHERVMVIGGKLPPDEERALYASAHCYLQPSRGEGFGLQPLQAMAQGLPTILTDAHGHESFAHLGIGISAKAAPADYFIYGDAGQWWEPSLDELVDQMRWVYDNYGQAVEDARIAAKVIAQEFTWENTADQFIEATELASAPAFDPSGTWVVPDPLLFRVRTKRDMRLNVAGRLLHLKGGVDYFEMADVKRILAEGGHLTGDCIDDGEGLTAEQVARLGGNDDHLYCTGCKQRYGSGTTKADELLLQYEAEALAREKSDADMTAWHAGA